MFLSKNKNQNYWRDEYGTVTLQARSVSAFAEEGKEIFNFLPLCSLCMIECRHTIHYVVLRILLNEYRKRYHH